MILPIIFLLILIYFSYIFVNKIFITPRTLKRKPHIHEEKARFNPAWPIRTVVAFRLSDLKLNIPFERAYAVMNIK